MEGRGRGRARVGSSRPADVDTVGGSTSQTGPSQTIRHSISTTRIINHMCIRSSLDFIRVMSIRRDMSITRGMMLSFSRGISLSSLLSPSMLMLLSSIMSCLLSSSLLMTVYDNISHGLVCAMAARWHQDTINFHLPVGEMTITLDDVACLLDIPVAGRLIEEDELDHDQGVDLMVSHLLFPVEDAVDQAANNSGAFVTYTTLKERYEQLLCRCCNALFNYLIILLDGIVYVYILYDYDDYVTCL